MYEYINDFKGQLICVKALHNKCGCHNCRKARIRNGRQVKVTYKNKGIVSVSKTKQRDEK